MADKIKRSVEYDIIAKDNASKTFRDVHGSAKSNLGGISGIAETVGGSLLTLGGLAGTAGLALGGFAIKSADDLEKGLLKFETLLGSEEEAQKRMSELTEFAAKTPFQLDDITKADIMLQGFGIRSEELLTNIGNAAAISGSSISDLSLVFGQLSQDKSLENIRQLVDRGVVSFNELEEAGIRFAEDRSIINSVEETYGAVVGIVEKKFAGGMEKLSGTISGKMSTLKDTFTLALAGMSEESGLNDFIKDMLGFLEDNLPSAIETAKSYFSDLGSVVMSNQDEINTFLDELKDTGEDTASMFTNLSEASSDAWNNNFLTIKTSVLSTIELLNYFGKVGYEMFRGTIETVSVLSDNYEFYWSKMKLSLFDFVNSTIDTVESWTKAILKPINTVREAMGMDKLKTDNFERLKIDTSYEQAVVSSFNPDRTVSDVWDDRMANVIGHAETYIENMANLQQEEKKREELAEAEKQVVINNYYNNQLNDKLTVDKMIERSNTKQREQLQSYGVNVI